MANTRWLLSLQNVFMEPQLLDNLREPLEIDRFNDVVAGPKFITFLKIWIVAGGAEHHDRNHSRPRVAFDPAQDVDAVDLGKFEIEQDEFRTPLLSTVVGGEHLQRLGSIVCHPDRVEGVVLPDHPDRQFSVPGVIFDEQDLPRLHGHVASPSRSE